VLTRKLGLDAGVSVTREATTLGSIWTVEFQSELSGFSLSMSDNTLNNGVGGAGTDTNVAINTLTIGTSFAACTGTHVIQGLTQGQVYFARVMAYNKIGYSAVANAASSAKPVKVPAPPIDVNLVVISGTSLRLIWSQNDDDGGDSISSYTIQWDKVSSFDSADLQSHVFSYLEGGAPFSYTLSNLEIGTPYCVRVSAANIEVIGEWDTSQPKKPMQAPSAPTDVRLLITSETALTVTFDEPVNQGGDDVTYYRVEWDVNDKFNSLYELPYKGYVDVPANLHRSYTIKDLQPGVKTFARVYTRNQVGYGPVQNTNPSSRAPAEQRPGKPYNVLLSTGSSGTLSVTWQAPRIPYHNVGCFGGGPSAVESDSLCPLGVGGRDQTTFSEADGGSPVTRYLVELDLQSDFVSSSSAPHKDIKYIAADDSDSFTTTFTGLAPGRKYYIRVAAENAIGVGAYAPYKFERPT
jgi:titin